MASFAELDKDNIVIRVLVVPDEQEHRGQEYLAEDCLLGGTWVQTSYNDRIRCRFAGEGFYYDETNDVFIKPKPYFSWILDSNTFEWNAPIPKPDASDSWGWDEEKQEWIE